MRPGTNADILGDEVPMDERPGHAGADLLDLIPVRVDELAAGGERFEHPTVAVGENGIGRAAMKRLARCPQALQIVPLPPVRELRDHSCGHCRRVDRPQVPGRERPVILGPGGVLRPDRFLEEQPAGLTVLLRREPEAPQRRNRHACEDLLVDQPFDRAGVDLAPLRDDRLPVGAGAGEPTDRRPALGFHDLDGSRRLARRPQREPPRDGGASDRLSVPWIAVRPLGSSTLWRGGPGPGEDRGSDRARPGGCGPHRVVLGPSLDGGSRCVWLYRALVCVRGGGRDHLRGLAAGRRRLGRRASPRRDFAHARPGSRRGGFAIARHRPLEARAECGRGSALPARIPLPPACLDDAPVLDPEPEIADREGVRTVGDDEAGPALREPPDRRHDRSLGLAVDGARRFVEEQDRRVLQEGARERDPLTLAPG